MSMNRRRFFAALFALPFAGKALETLAAAAPPAVQQWVGVQKFRSSIVMSADMVDVAAFDAYMREVTDSIRRQIEDSIMNGDDHAWQSQPVRVYHHRHRSPSNRRRRNAAWRRAHS